MKKLHIYIAAIILLLTVQPITASAGTNKTKQQTSEVRITQERADQLDQRLGQISSMEKSNLSFSEKKALRNEVKAIKSELKAASHDGVYISAGALILIIILLIILF